LSPYTDRKMDAYGGNPEGRMKLLKRLVTEICELYPALFCLSVKLNSGDYMVPPAYLKTKHWNKLTGS